MKGIDLRRLVIGAMLALLVLVPVQGVLAQDTPDEQTDQEKKEEETGQPYLETITVTAQKRVEDVQDVPVAVTAMGSKEVETLTTGGADVRALSGRVPSLQIESSFGRAFPRFYIRGLGNTDFDLNASQPVSMLYDGVVLENPILKGMPLWDLDRIEVLRGPQGTLFGRNTPAGAIKFESKQPTRDFESYLIGSYGTFGTLDLKGAISGPLSDTVSARLSYLVQSQQDWVDNGFTGENDALGGYKNYAYRAQVLWNPDPRMHALLNVHGWNVDGTARIFYANMIKVGTDEPVAGFDRRKVYHDGLNEQNIDARGGLFKVDYAFDNGTLTSITALETVDMYSRGDIDGGYGAVYAPPSGPGFIPFVSESADGIPSLDQFTQEVRFASNLPGTFQWLAGAFFFDENLKAETYSYNSLAPGNPVEGYATQKQNATSWAAFGSIDKQMSDRLHLKAGLRFTHDQKDFAAERPIPVFLNVATIAPITAHTNANFVNWDLSLTWAKSESVNYYTRIATGSRAPSIQGRILFAPDMEGGTDPATNGVSVADTENLLSAEVGIKSELLDRKLRFNADIYRYVVNDQQVTAVGGQYNVATILNADKSIGYGLESDIQWAPTTHWLATLGLSYNHTRIDDPNLTVAPCVSCTVLNPVVDGLVYIDGNSLPHAPEWIFNGVIDYKTPAGAGQINGSLDWYYYSKKQFFLYESKEFQGDGLEIGLRLGYAWRDGDYEVALFGRNITDEMIIQGGVDFNNLTGMTNEPRIIGLQFMTKF